MVLIEPARAAGHVDEMLVAESASVIATSRPLRHDHAVDAVRSLPECGTSDGTHPGLAMREKAVLPAPSACIANTILRVAPTAVRQAFC